VPLEDVELPRRKGRTLGSGKSMARDTERILRDEFRRRGR